MITNGGMRLRGTTPEEMVDELHTSSRAPCDSRQQFMNEVASRTLLWNGRQVRTETAAVFIKDLLAAGSLTNKRIGDAQIIKVLVLSNPKRPGSACRERFDRYENGMTVGEALDRGITRKDLYWDLDRGFISVKVRVGG